MLTYSDIGSPRLSSGGGCHFLTVVAFLYRQGYRPMKEGKDYNIDGELEYLDRLPYRLPRIATLRECLISDWQLTPVCRFIRIRRWWLRSKWRETKENLTCNDCGTLLRPVSYLREKMTRYHFDAKKWPIP